MLLIRSTARPIVQREMFGRGCFAPGGLEGLLHNDQLCEAVFVPLPYGGEDGVDFIEPLFAARIFSRSLTKILEFFQLEECCLLEERMASCSVEGSSMSQEIQDGAHPEFHDSWNCPTQVIAVVLRAKLSGRRL